MIKLTNTVEENTKVIENILKNKDLQQIRLFAWRNALRMAWYLQDLPVKSKLGLDKFYYYYLCHLMYCLRIVNVITPNESAGVFTGIGGTATAAYTDAAYTAYSSYAAAAIITSTNAASAYTAAAYAAAYATIAIITDITTDELYIKQLNNDLELLSSKQDLAQYSLWMQDDYRKIKLPIDAVWIDNIFNAAQDKTLFQANKKTEFYIALTKLTEEVLEVESANAMANFINNAINNKIGITNRARLILLGNGGAGKTSLVRCIFAEDLIANEQSTPKIEIREKKYNELSLDIWDFGGQVIMHSSHIFFLSAKSTYIIMCNQRSNEQPDEWLDILIPHMDKNTEYKNTVLIIYSHCDDSINHTTWSRKTTIIRKYGKYFYFEFFNIDLTPKVEKKTLKIILDKIKKQALKQGQADVEIWMAKIYNIKQVKISLKDIKQKFINSNQKFSNNSLRVMRNYGYIFPEREFEYSENLPDDFMFIIQKHWLTYGLYCLINQQINNDNGNYIIDTEFIKKALCVGKTRYLVDGVLYDDKAKAKNKNKNEDKLEEIIYKNEDIALFKKILINYKFGIHYHKLHDQILLPLAMPEDEPEYYNKLWGEDDNTQKYMEFRFKTMPKDLFFRLITFVEQHLKEKNHLWRTGVILHHFANTVNINTTKALLKIDGNILSLRTKGSNAQQFLQLLSFNIQAVLADYKNIDCQHFEKIAGNLLSFEVLNAITNNSDNFIENITKHIMEKGLMGNTININGNNNIVGDNNTVINNIDNSIKQLQEKFDKHNPDILELITALEEYKKNPQDKSILSKISSVTDKLVKIKDNFMQFIPSLATLLA